MLVLAAHPGQALGFQCGRRPAGTRGKPMRSGYASWYAAQCATGKAKEATPRKPIGPTHCCRAGMQRRAIQTIAGVKAAQMYAASRHWASASQAPNSSRRSWNGSLK